MEGEQEGLKTYKLVEEWQREVTLQRPQDSHSQDFQGKGAPGAPGQPRERELGTSENYLAPSSHDNRPQGWFSDKRRPRRQRAAWRRW